VDIDIFTLRTMKKKLASLVISGEVGGRRQHGLPGNLFMRNRIRIFNLAQAMLRQIFMVADSSRLITSIVLRLIGD